MESEDTVAAVAATTPLLENDDSANVVDVHDRREDLIRISSMIGLVLLGLVFVIIVFFWPLIFASLIFPHTIILWAAPMAEVIHFCSLVWIPYPYLYIHRKTLYPLRRLLMPLVNQISKSESIREKESTWYNKCSELPRTRDAKELLTHFKMSVRKDLKKKLKLFFQHNITTETFHGDYLSLRQDIPIMWEHEKRTVRGTDKSVVEEFVKRFLVVFLVTNAYIDRYYDGEGNMCALGLFVASKNTLNNFLYFCLEKERLSGIWQYNHFRTLLRGAAADEMEFVNFQVHQDYAKRLAGATSASYRDLELLSSLYPFALYKEPPLNVVDLKITQDCL